MSIATALTLSILALQAGEPPPGPAPTVSYGVLLVDVRRIDDVRQTMEVDFVVNLEWRDRSLANPGGEGIRQLDLGSVWNPAIAILNQERLRKGRPDVVRVDADGNVVFLQRYTVTITQRLDLTEFPFDHQVFKITALSYRSADEPVSLVFDENLGGELGGLTILDWHLDPGTCRNTTLRAQHSRAAAFEYVFEGRRRVAYYVWKLLLPMLVIVGMSFAVFWIDPSFTASQIGVATTSVLTLIAFRFAVSHQIPRLSYLTRLDLFNLGCTLLVFFAFLEVIATTNLVGRHEHLARRLDRVCRRAFPIALLLVIVFTLLV